MSKISDPKSLHLGNRRKEPMPCPDNEFTTDLEYQPSMDSAYHAFLQPKYAKEFKKWRNKK